ncbi:MAG: DNA-processing protein DprA [Candidatus Riflebacteria bacterium]|nr:DNA-processing protein DprA [Candidatus Riflebacteria bacterium]
MEEIDEIEIAIRLSRSKGVGAAGFKRLIDEFKLPSVAKENWLREQSERKLNKVSLGKNSSEEQINNTLEYIRESKCIARYYGQLGYPEQLKVLTEPPPIVYMSSDLKTMPLAAVVGSRKVDGLIIEKAKYYTEKLVDEGYGIVSGGAVGIDEISHETALKKNAYTVAVIANGIDVVYPSNHKELFERIKEKGLLITELMVGAKPHKSFFPTRNRLIAAMADIVVTLPASNSSGTLITMNWAKKLGKKVICPL